MTVYYKMRGTLLQNAKEVYYKMRQVLYYKMRQLLQNATFITNCDSTYMNKFYYKTDIVQNINAGIVLYVYFITKLK